MTQATLSTVKGIVRAIILVATTLFATWFTPDHVALVTSSGAVVWAIFEAITGVVSDNPIYITPPTPPAK